jgi:polyhydroxyalkanoate synthesis regulator phasin
MKMARKQRTQRKAHKAAPTAQRALRKRAALLPGAVRKGARTAGKRIQTAWAETLDTLTAAQVQLERRIKELLKRNKISTKDAASMLADVRALADRQGRRALRGLRVRVGSLQTRLQKERKTVGHAVGDAVHSALAALNIPSRQEVASLTRKVEELSKKLDRLKR